MKVCVQGLWHLGSVTAGCLASLGHDVTGLDFDDQTIANFQKGILPVDEPGLSALIEDGITKGNLRFTGKVKDAVSGAQVLWITYDTPVDDDDKADVDFVFRQVESTLPLLEENAVVVVSSQMPVGSIAQLEQLASRECSHKNLSFCSSPENLRLGRALEAFLNPDRVVLGIRDDEAKDVLCDLFDGITENFVWMGVESAEMTKHAINAFLGMSIAFTNEFAAVCEQVNADAREVEIGLKTEQRIGPGAYLAPGSAFSGGTLARDLKFLEKISSGYNLTNPIFSSVLKSNNEHKKWVQRRIRSVLGDLKGKSIAVWGLTYKPGTDTLRRSLSVETCDWLHQEGAQIIVHDPSECIIPDRWSKQAKRVKTPLTALHEASALIIGTPWPEYRELSLDDIKNSVTKGFVVFDSDRILGGLSSSSGISYFSVGVGDE